MPMDYGNGPIRRPPGPEDLLAEAMKRYGGRMPKFGGALLAGVLLALWVATGFYQVNPSEVGVVLRFGRVANTTTPGLHWHLPWPVDSVVKVPVTVVRKEEIGFRTIAVGPPARYRSVVEESRMLTADGNIVDVDFIVQYRISDPVQYLFEVRDPVETLRDLSESAMREVVGHNSIDFALTEGRAEIQTGAQDILQELLDRYRTGLQVTTVKLQDVTPPEPVQDAFKDVINAEQDKERMINEAEGFSNDILPKARGTAATWLNEARAYGESVVKKAEGEAGRFDLIYEAYSQAPDVTRKRMYLETLEQILPDADKTLLDDTVSKNALPLLSLGGALPRSAPAEATP